MMSPALFYGSVFSHSFICAKKRVLPSKILKDMTGFVGYGRGSRGLWRTIGERDGGFTLCIPGKEQEFVK